MKVGIPTEIKTDEYRVAITPAGVRELTERGHDVFIQSAAGEGSAMKDEDYVAQGAQIVADAQSVFDEAELILKVKEPMPEEVERLQPGHALFTYLHLAPAPDLTRALCESGSERFAGLYPRAGWEMVVDCVPGEGKPRPYIFVVMVISGDM